MNILNKLTIKHLTMNKKRTIVSIVGIILSTALMVGIGLLLSTFREMMIDDIITYNGDYHVEFKSVDESKINLVKNNSNVDDFYYKESLGYSKLDNIENEYKPYYKVYETSSGYLENLKLIDGRLPETKDEIVVSTHVINDGGIDLKIGDKITFNLGERYHDGYKLSDIDNELYIEGEYLENINTRTYTIVGIISRDILESYESPGYSVFTILNNETKNSANVYVKFKNPSKTYELSETLATTLGLEKINDHFTEIDYNSSLLSMYGASKYDNLIGGMAGMLAIMLALVSVACIIVIYNSFAISVMERKKQFGLFSSIGATRKQIRKTVLFEAFVVSLIGIPLGILGSYIGIGVVVFIMNNLLNDIIMIELHLCTYPIFVIIPIIFMIITIFVSAILPARRASKISPIEAIRLNDDIKIKGKKVKSPKIIKKIFGIEGDIAYKNMKRNKKKYRITVVSLFISIVLFISFSGYITYMFAGTSSYLNVPNFDIQIDYAEVTDMEIIDKIKNHPDVDEYATYTLLFIRTQTAFESIYTDKWKDYMNDKHPEFQDDLLSIFILDDKTYNNYLKKIGKKEAKPILYTKFNAITYGQNSRKAYTFNKYKNKIIDIDISNYIYDEETEDNKFNHISTIKDYYVTDLEFLSLEVFGDNLNPIIIMNEEQALEYNLKNNDNGYNMMLMIKSSDYKDLDKFIEEKIEKEELEHTFYQNLDENFKMIKNLILALKILVYGFISLVTLIGITSVFNTINTSIALRRKEFAVLRSIGLTPNGFNKTLCFESLFFGLKALFYGIPVSFGIILLMHLSMGNIVEMDSILIPWTSIILAVFGVFVVIGISMMYATSKIKNENIIDAIREENI